MIGLMDCNNFFVSCERLFRPELSEKPVLVLSSNDGCVVSRSKEVKELGISMGIPYFQIEKLCKKESITVFSSNFTLYRDISRRVMTALKELVGAIEIYSVDEAFFTLDDAVSTEEVLEIRRIIMQKTGIPVSIGVAKTKTIAKAASEAAKKRNGATIMNDDAWQTYRNTMTCGSVWGIGRQTTAKLTSLGITTVGLLMEQDRSFLKNTFGVFGERLYLELSGITAHELGSPHDTEQGSITSTRSFKHEIYDRAFLESAIGYHVSEVAEKLRERGLCATTLSVFCGPSRFSSYAGHTAGETITLIRPTNETAALLREAKKILHDRYESGVPYKKAGVIASQLVREDSVTAALFNDHGDWGPIDNTVDSINKQFGHGTIVYGVVGRTKEWRESRRFCSPAYTTKWQEIAIVKAN